MPRHLCDKNNEQKDIESWLALGEIRDVVRHCKGKINPETSGLLPLCLRQRMRRGCCSNEKQFGVAGCSSEQWRLLRGCFKAVGLAGALRRDALLTNRTEIGGYRQNPAGDADRWLFPAFSVLEGRGHSGEGLLKSE